MAFLRASATHETGLSIEGAGVMLRAPQAGDFGAWSQLREISREHLAPFEPQWAGDELSRLSFRRRIRHYQRELRGDLGYAFFVFDQSGANLAGGITLSNVRRGVTQAATLGYWIGVSFADRGMMSAAVRALMPFAFDTLRLHRVEAASLISNETSIRVLEKNGFQHEGLARNYLKINGSWQDHFLFALLEDDRRK